MTPPTRTLHILAALLSIILLGAVLTPFAAGAAADQLARPGAPVPPSIVEVRGVVEGATLSGTAAIEVVVQGPRIARVLFILDGPQRVSYTERNAPYFFMGDDNGVPRGWNTTAFPNGAYRLTIRVFNRDNQSAERVISFGLLNGNQPPTSTPTATATHTPTPAAPTATATHTPTPAAPTATATHTPTPAAGGAPVAGQKCPDSVHDEYMVTGPDGQRYRTWHAPTDPRYGCWFGHEHGSDPHTFPSFTQIGTPAFGYSAATIGLSEPHVGFKVFVVNDQDRGVWWMATFHQGTSGAARAFARYHSLDLAVARADGTLLANVHLMADTGNSYGKCAFQGPAIAGSGPQGRGGARKTLPTSDCPGDVYESWSTYTEVVGLLEAYLTFDIDNGVTVLVRQPDGSYSTTDVAYTASLICPGIDPNQPGNDCDRFGDKRSVINPRIVLKNTTGSSEIWTDAYGKLTSAGQGIRQFVAANTSADLRPGTNFINGLNRTNRNIYISLNYCTDSNDCNPRNFNDGTVRIPN